MELYLCKVWDGRTDEGWVDLGVFSSEANALEAGGLYIVENAVGVAHLLDWDESLPTLIYWYQDDQYNPFTRVVTKVTLDERLA